MQLRILAIACATLLLAETASAQPSESGNPRDSRPIVGIRILAIDGDLGAALGIAEGNGALVTSVAPRGPAARARIRPGDVILAVDGEAVAGPEGFSEALTRHGAGATVTVQIHRGGERLALEVTSAAGPGDGDIDRRWGRPVYYSNASRSGAGEGSQKALGIRMRTFTSDFARAFDMDRNLRGAFVAWVDATSRAEAAGLRRGDLILQVDLEPVGRAEDAARLMRAAASAGRPALLYIQRRSTLSYFAVRDGRIQPPEPEPAAAARSASFSPDGSGAVPTRAAAFQFLREALDRPGIARWSWSNGSYWNPGTRSCWRSYQPSFGPRVECAASGTLAGFTVDECRLELVWRIDRITEAVVPQQAEGQGDLVRHVWDFRRASASLDDRGLRLAHPGENPNSRIVLEDGSGQRVLNAFRFVRQSCELQSDTGF